MKIRQQILYFLIGSISFLNLSSNAQEASPRKTLNFNREWKYFRGDIPNAETVEFNDANWEQIGLPHSFSIPYFMSKDFYVGYGWYRKPLTLTKKDLKKKIFLEFDGVFQETEIFVNGEKTGSHEGGYTGFSIDLTDALHAGENLIAVRVNNLWKPDLAPRAGEHVFSGGIYRNVRLVMKDPVYIDWYGTFVTTPDLAKNQGNSSTVRIETDLCNRSEKDVSIRLKTEITDASGHIISQVESKETIPAGQNRLILQTTPSIAKPALWHPKHPHLYKVASTLYEGKKAIDHDETVLGFRWFEWTADKGFFLNGAHYYFKGANVHQDHAGWGDAVTESGARRDVRLIKEAGFDLIRGSHYPHSPAFSRACDEEGMLFWSENAFWGIGGFRPDGYWNCSAYPVREEDRPEFDASVKKQLAEMIRIHRNHPSIILWSMSNEPFFSAPEAMDGMRNLLKETVKLAHQLDPTRPAAIGGCQRPLGKDRIDLIGDVAGYNGDGSIIPDFQKPGIPSVVTEYGSTTADRPGRYEPGWGDLRKNNSTQGLPWRSGQAIWCGFDHGSIAGSALGKMGMIDYFRIPKRMWYWYRNEYRNIAPPEWPTEGVPAQIRLTADKTRDIHTDGTEDTYLHLTILDAAGKPISNSPSIELTLVSGPGEFPTGSSIRFDKDSDIRIADGQAAIEFRSYYAGTSVIRATSPGLKSAEITLQFIGNSTFKEGKTPQVKERSYTRFVRENESPIVQKFGRNNPTFSSSSINGHTSGFAADGNPETYWQAATDDAEPHWILDTEKNLALNYLKIQFPRPAVYQYRIETSENKTDWKILFSNEKNTKPENSFQFAIPEKTNARFVRIVFLNTPATIAEVEVTGIVNE